jgi:glycosyltransferase involved in cell wall biosynthesis
MDRSVSCIIPVFNMEAWLGEAVASVLAQSVTASEIIVVDDGSTDASAIVAERFGPAVTLIRQAHAGVSAARNRGIAAARGAFIAFLDADDRFYPDRFREQLAAFAEDPALAFCDAHSEWFWSEDLPEEERRADPRYDFPFWRTASPGHIGTWLVRRELFSRIGLFDETLSFSEDTDWLLRARDAGIAMRTLPQSLAARRLHRGNATAGSRTAQVKSLIGAIRRSHLRRAQTE